MNMNHIFTVGSLIISSVLYQLNIIEFIICHS